MKDKNNNYELLNLLNQKDIEIKQLKIENEDINKKNNYLNNMLKQYYSSAGWKITKQIGKFKHFFKLNDHEDLNRSEFNIISQLDKPVSIIIPIYNAYSDTQKCIESIYKNTQGQYEMILIDDNSSDERINSLLETLKDRSNVKIIRNKKNKGFVKNVNIGLKATNNDVILLNSDTIVTPKWIQKLVICAYSDEKIGTVTPVSNNAGAFSVPVINIDNQIPSELGIEGMSKLVEKCSEKLYMRVPTANGFCMYIKRNTINSVGLFDEKNFGKGYGEENDYSMRAIEKGWLNVIDDSCYIYHKQGASFGDDTSELKRKNRKLLDIKYPHYTGEIGKFINSKKLKFICSNVEKCLNEYYLKKYIQKDILLLLNSFDEKYIKNYLINHNILHNYFVLCYEKNKLNFYYCNKLDVCKLKTWKIDSNFNIEHNITEDFIDIFYQIITKYQIDIIYTDYEDYSSYLIKLSNNFGISFENEMA